MGIHEILTSRFLDPRKVLNVVAKNKSFMLICQVFAQSVFHLNAPLVLTMNPHITVHLLQMLSIFIVLRIYICHF